jgi:hypothetical protein
MWSSLWVERPDARVRFDLSPEGSGSGTQLRWTLLFDQPLPEHTLLSHLRKRLNVLIFRGGAPPSGRDRPRQSCSADKASTSRLTDTTTAEAELRTLPMANPRLVRAPTSEPRLRSPPARPPPSDRSPRRPQRGRERRGWRKAVRPSARRCALWLRWGPGFADPDGPLPLYHVGATDQVATLPHRLLPKLSRLIAQVCRPTIPSSPTWP